MYKDEGDNPQTTTEQGLKFLETIKRTEDKRYGDCSFSNYCEAHPFYLTSSLVHEQEPSREHSYSAYLKLHSVQYAYSL